ncbi:MAG: hypothetical protein QM692_09695 [Thermomicrobiales bacterium]
MMTQSGSRRAVLGLAAALGGAVIAEISPAGAARRRRRGRGRRQKTTVTNTNESSTSFNESNTSVVVGPDGPDGPDANVVYPPPSPES